MGWGVGPQRRDTVVGTIAGDGYCAMFVCAVDLDLLLLECLQDFAMGMTIRITGSSRNNAYLRPDPFHKCRQGRCTAPVMRDLQNVCLERSPVLEQPAFCGVLNIAGK